MYKRVLLYFLCLFTLRVFITPSLVYASAAGEVNKANDLYRLGKFDDSLKLYQKALEHDEQSPVVKYDLGTALYKKGDYAKALGYLEEAAQDKNLKMKPQVEYNIGNDLYKSGMQKADSNVDEAIKTLQEALGHYGKTIAVHPKDRDALFNEDFVKKEIERLKKKKQQQQQKKQQRQQKQKQDQQNKKNQQGQQNQQEQKNKQQQKNQQTKQGGPKEQENKNDQGTRQQPSASQKQQNAQGQETPQELDRKQAEDLLSDYQENEEPKKLLNYMPKKIDDRPVLKDW